jgi:hypothetical protein
VGSTSKPVGAMDACGSGAMLVWYRGNFIRGYGCSLAAKQCQEKRDEEHTYVDVFLLIKVKTHG